MSGLKHVHLLIGFIGLLAMALLCTYLLRGQIPGQLYHAFEHFAIDQQTQLQTTGYKQMQTEHFIIKYQSVDEECLPMVAKAAEKAYDAVTVSMGQKPASKTLLVIYPDNSSMADSFGWDRNEKAMGVYWGGTIRVLTPREWMQNPQEFDIFMHEGPMVHEFAHLLVDQMSGGNYNRWWTEGIAQYVEKKITGFEFVDPFADEEKPSYYTLDKMEKAFDHLDQQVAYWESLRAVEYIVDQYGEESVYMILQQLGSGASMDQAVESVLGVEYSSFAKDFYQYLQDN